MLDECAFAVVDVETTGSRALGDRVLEVGVVVVQGPRRELIYDRVVNPERPVPWAITNLTRITEAEAKAAPLFEDQADEVIGALAGASSCAQRPVRLGIHRLRAPAHPWIHARRPAALHRAAGSAAGAGWPSPAGSTG
jgi:hypothetical protein